MQEAQEAFLSFISCELPITTFSIYTEFLEGVGKSFSGFVNNSIPFDVTIGSYDGAEVCTLVGLFILSTSKLFNKYRPAKIGQYLRDDGIAALKNTGPRTASKIRKGFSNAIKEFALKITAQVNMKVVEYLDIPIPETRQPASLHKRPLEPPTTHHQVIASRNQNLLTVMRSSRI